MHQRPNCLKTGNTAGPPAASGGMSDEKGLGAHSVVPPNPINVIVPGLTRQPGPTLLPLEASPFDSFNHDVIVIHR